jgi:hypothetical protein
MRSDMAKVIVERPRFGSRLRSRRCNGHRRDEQKLGVAALPKFEGMKRPYGHDTKGLNEHLGPLRRYLDSKVGQPWDKVFGEICAHIRCDSAVQSHVRDHVMDYVCRNAVLIDGVPCEGDGRNYGRPLHDSRRWSWWYVCPASGILKRIERRFGRPNRRGNARRRNELPTPAPVRLDESHVCAVVQGRWCLILVRKLMPPNLAFATPWERQRWNEQCDLACREYGALVEPVSSRPLSKGEMQQLPVPVDRWKQRRWWTKPRRAKHA